MNTILSQLSQLFTSNLIQENTFYIDKCPDRRDLEGVRCKYLSNNSDGIKFVNEADNQIEVLPHSTLGIISAR